MVSAGYFPLLGVEPALGRTFLPEEDAVPGEAPVALIAYAVDRPVRSGLSARRTHHIAELHSLHRPRVTGLSGQADVWVPMMMAPALTFANRLGEDHSFTLHLCRRLIARLGKRPGFTLVTVISLALGVAANTVLFSLVKGVMLEPLPYPDSGDLIRIYDTHLERGGTAGTSSPANLYDWRNQQNVFTDMMGFTVGRATFIEVHPPEAVTAANESAETFRVLGVMPARGRPFSRAEEQPGSDRIVIVSHGLWQRYLSSDPRVTSRTLSLNGEAYEVVGVIRPGFEFPSRGTQLGLPLSFERARAGMTALMAQPNAAYPDRAAGWSVRLVGCAPGRRRPVKA